MARMSACIDRGPGFNPWDIQMFFSQPRALSGKGLIITVLSGKWAQTKW